VRILFVKRMYEPIGGSESLTYQLATRLVGRGHDVRVVCCWPPRSDGRRYRAERFRPEVYEDHRIFHDRGVEVVQVKPRGGIIGSAVDSTTLVDLMRMEVLEAYAQDREIIHNVCREYLDSSIEAAARTGAAVVLTPLPHPGQFHGGDTPEDIARYRRADAITAMTEWERRWYARHGIDLTRVVVSGLGSNAHRTTGHAVEFRHRQGIPPSAPIVLFIGRKERYKGYIQLLDATELVWREFPDTRFIFIGIQGWYSTFFDDFARYRDERILNFDNVTPEFRGAALEACDVFTMPSVHESFGIPYLEAWTYEKPVIAGDIPTSREIITPGVDGLLVPQRAERVADAILTLLRDPALRAALGRAGHAKVARYTWDRALDRTEEAYDLALSRRASRVAERALA
jgi:glycosyltransferase involved in cell wall biosynthesis